jgi:hypothetical protein
MASNADHEGESNQPYDRRRNLPELCGALLELASRTRMWLTFSLSHILGAEEMCF